MDAQPVQKPFEPARPVTPQPQKKARPMAWISVTVVLAIALIASIITGGFGMTGGFIAADPNSAANRAISFINSNVLAGGVTAELNEVKEASGLYLMNFTVSGQKYSAYVSKDGSLLFPQFIDMSTASSGEPSDQQAGFNPPKTDKPTVQMFVMSFCPYGKQAEQGMGPAIAALGDSITFEPHFIVSVSGDTVSSLHGTNEAQEDMRQAVIWKYWPAKFWTYVNYVNAHSTVNDISTTWKEAAKAAGLDSAQVEAKVTAEGLQLMKAEAALSESLGVSSSPTILVNGADYSGDRSAEAFKTGICSAFNTEPAACGQELSDNATAASGNCG